MICKGSGSTTDYTTPEVTITTPPQKLDAPLITSIEPIWDGNSEQVSALKVKWEPKTADHAGYVISWALNGVSQGSSDQGFNKNLTEFTIRKGNAQTWPGCKANYEVKVRAVLGGGFAVSLQSPDAVKTIAATVRKPDAPQNVRTSVAGTTITVNWDGFNQAESVESGFTIEYAKTADFNGAASVTRPANEGVYAISGLTGSQAYYVRVRANNCNTNSDWSNTANATTAAGPVPTAPEITKNLSQNWTKNSDRVTVIKAEWTDKSNNETGFEIQWGNDEQYTGGSASVGANITNYDVDGSWPGCGHKVYIRVRAKGNGTESGWSATTLTTSIAIPERPLNVKAEVLSHNQIKVSWEGANESYSRESEFLIRCNNNYLGGGDPTYKADANTDSKIIDVAANTQFFVSMIAKNCAGNSEWSNLVAAKTPAAPTVSKPKAPTNLVATAINSTQVNLSWTDNATDEVGFNIERSTDQSNWTTAGDIGSDTKAFTVNNLSPNTKYYFRVFARNNGGNSDYSNVAEATTQAPTPAKPDKPTNLAAVATSSTQINLSWTDASGNEEGFDIERSTDNATWVNPATVAANVTTYSVTGLTANTKYYFRVRAKNGAGQSDWSNVAEATTQAAPITKPATPTNLKATASNSAQIDLSWTDASSNEEGFDIERSTDNATWGNPVTLPANTVTYSAMGLTASTKYYFRVRARLGATPSDWSNVAEATTPAAPVVKPATPLNLVATPVSTTQVSLIWTDASSNEEGFEIERSTDNTTWGNPATVAANTIAYLVSGLTASTKYYFRARAKLGTATSDWSNVAEATTSALPILKPVAPSNLRLKTATVANQISIEWDDNATDETAYELSRATDSPTNWQVLKADLPANTKEFTDTPVRSGSKYFYRIRALRTSDFSDYSNVLETVAPVVSATLPEEIANWQVYPNPVVETVQIDLNSTAMHTLAVVNALGQEVCRTTIRNNTTLRIADWPAGLYLMQIKTANYSKTFRLLKR
ncbi:hypothetical protein GCM10028807_28480 [Spirosoma daeguense]